MAKVGVVQVRASRCEKQVDRLDVRVQHQELRVDQMQAQLEEFWKELMLAKALEPEPSPSQMLGQESWDRHPESNVLRANCLVMVALKGVLGLVDGLATGVGIPMSTYVVESLAAVSKNVAVCSFGEPRAGTRRAAQLLGTLRSPSWV